LATDTGLRNELSRNAAVDAEQKYSLAANKVKIVEAFESALDHGNYAYK
jgi:hypothetical protein